MRVDVATWGAARVAVALLWWWGEDGVGRLTSLAVPTQMGKLQLPVVLAVHHATCLCVERCEWLLCFRLPSLVNALIYGRYTVDSVTCLLGGHKTVSLVRWLVCFRHDVHGVVRRKRTDGAMREMHGEKKRCTETQAKSRFWDTGTRIILARLFACLTT